MDANQTTEWVDFLRVWMEQKIDIPPEQVVLQFIVVFAIFFAVMFLSDKVMVWAEKRKKSGKSSGKVYKGTEATDN